MASPALTKIRRATSWTTRMRRLLMLVFHPRKNGDYPDSWNKRRRAAMQSLLIGQFVLKLPFNNTINVDAPTDVTSLKIL